jgi:hypothetical protein
MRFHVLPRVLVDAKRRLSGARLAERRSALGRFTAALRLVAREDDEPTQGHASLLWGASPI